jgi:hypothetical protein
VQKFDEITKFVILNISDTQLMALFINDTQNNSTQHKGLFVILDISDTQINDTVYKRHSG